MTQDSNEKSQLKDLVYPAVLELRVISNINFDCEAFVKLKGIKPLSQGVTFSKNQNFKTFKFEYKYESYDQYLQLRTELCKEADVQLVL